MRRYANAASSHLQPRQYCIFEQSRAHNLAHIVAILCACPRSPQTANRRAPLPISQFFMAGEDLSKGHYSLSRCYITNDGSTCTGDACTSSSSNNCASDRVTVFEPQILCLYWECDNQYDNCNHDGYTVTWNAKDTGPCTADSQCTSGSCKGGDCCTEKGMSTGCTDCWQSNGVCKACSSQYDYTLTDYECIADADVSPPPPLPPSPSPPSPPPATYTGSCTAGSECTSGSCKGGNCCNSMAYGSMSAGCAACSYMEGNCETCSSGYTKDDMNSEWNTECVEDESSTTTSTSSTDVCSTACAGSTDKCTVTCPDGRVDQKLAAV